MSNDLKQLFENRIAGSVRAVESLRKQMAELTAIANLIIERLQGDGTLYTAGNGGSAAEALHLAEELIGRYRSNRKPLRAVCLNADPTALTCIANDFGFEEVFARQCEALLRPDDLLLVFTTSGNSPNIVRALQIARKHGAAAIGFLGNDGGACLPLCDHAIVVRPDQPGDSAPIQEAHQVALHLICEAIERQIRD
jgi:D-sedoheptulose 7-phosphate isomerase